MNLEFACNLPFISPDTFLTAFIIVAVIVGIYLFLIHKFITKRRKLFYFFVVPVIPFLFAFVLIQIAYNLIHGPCFYWAGEASNGLMPNLAIHQVHEAVKNACYHSEPNNNCPKNIDEVSKLNSGKLKETIIKNHMTYIYHPKDNTYTLFGRAKPRVGIIFDPRIAKIQGIQQDYLDVVLTASLTKNHKIERSWFYNYSNGGQYKTAVETYLQKYGSDLKLD